MAKKMFSKVTAALLACLLLITQSVAYATDVVIENPTPDLIAPLINNISVTNNELTPTSPVKVIADITDELSGFSDGYITYTKPNNQSINAPFVLNTTTNQYEATITVASTGVAGTWKATTIFLRDKKDNTVYLSHMAEQSNGEKIDFTPLHLNVTGVTPAPEPTDKQAPVLRSIQVNAQKLTVNDKLQLTAEVTDDESGVASVTANYKKPSGATKSISLSSNAAGQFVGSYTIGKYDESGDWTLVSVTARDKAGNSKTYTSYLDSNNNTMNFSNCLVTISGTIVDKEAPVLRDISVTSQVVRPNEKLEVRAEVTDNESGVASVRASYKKPDGSTSNIDLYKTASGQFVGSVTIGQYEERGIRTLSAVYMSDALGNSQTVTSYVDNSNVNKTFAHCTVEVTGTTPDWEGPEFISGAINVRQVSNVQAEVTLTVGVEDRLSGIANGTLTGAYKKPNGKLLNLSFNKVNNNQYSASILIDKYDLLGKWELNNLSIRDNVGNYTKPDQLGVAPLSEFDFNVLGKITITPGTPNHITLDGPVELSNGQTYQLKPRLGFSNASLEEVDITNDPLTKYTSSNTELAAVNSQGLIQVPNNVASGNVTVEVTYGNVRKTIEIKINGGKTDSYLQVSPLLVTMHAGQSEQLKVVEINDGARKDVTNSSSGITYTSSDPTVVMVTPDGLINTVSDEQQGTFYINVNYKGLKAKTTVKVSKPVVKSLAISPLEETLSLSNNKLQLVLKAFMTDGTTKDVTNGSEGTKYISSDPKRATVDANGLVSVPANAISGKVTIKATNSNLVAQTTLTIDGNPELTGIEIIPESPVLSPGGTKKIKVVAKYSNNTTKDITAGSSGVVYTSSNPARAVISADGEITVPGDAPLGTAVITAKFEAFQTTATLNVVKDITNEIQSIAVTPEAITMKPEETQQIKVTATMGDDRLKDITASSEGTTYTSSNTDRAVVDAEGKITIPKYTGAGTATISVKNKLFQRTVVLTIVKNATNEIKSLEVKPANVTLKLGDTQQLTVTAVMGDDTRKDMTSSKEGTVYTSTNTARAMVDAEGLVTIPPNATFGTVTITAKNGISQSTVVVTVGKDPATEMSKITASPGTVTLVPEETQQLTVTATMGDGSTKDVTRSTEGTVYMSSNTDRAVVDAEGKITIPKYASAGTVVITAKNGTLQSTAVVTVAKNPATEIKSIAVNPATVTLAVGFTKQLVVTATMGDGSLKDMTSSSEGTVYMSSNTARATVDAEGLITIPANATFGTVTITAKNGISQSTVVVTVGKDPATEMSKIIVTPGTVTLAPEETQQLTVTATMGDGSTKDVTRSTEGTVYMSSNTDRAVVDAEGKITIPKYASAGTVVITAKNGTLQSTTVVTVAKNPATEIKSIAVNPATVTLAAGFTKQLVVTATMGDGSLKDMTISSEGTVYTSSNTARATVDAEGLITIPANATFGTVTITAKNGISQSTVTVTVGKDPATEMKSIAVNPATVTLTSGDTKQLTVTATMGDGSIKDVTRSTEGTVYMSSNIDRAVVDAEGKITIPKYASAGTVVITAKNGTLQSTTVVTVAKNPATEIKSIAVNPATVTLAAGFTKQLVVTATMGDGSLKDMTSSSEGTVYTSSNTARATVDAEGLITIPANATMGTVTITVKNGISQSTVNVTVGKDPATDMKSIAVTPGTVTLAPGDAKQILVTATMGDGSVKDVTASSKGTVYTSSIPTRALVDTEGNITIPSNATFGTVVITAKNGILQSTVTVTVGKNPATEMKSVAISPSSITLAAGGTQQLTVTATMGDGSQKDVTASTKGTIYTSSNINRAVVDTEGNITIPSNATLGTVVITAKNGIFQSTVIVTVGKNMVAEVKGITVTPDTVTLAAGDVRQLSVIATMGDGSLKDVTSSSEGTVYTSSNSSRAMVDAEGKVTIPMTTTAGTVTITVKNGLFTKTVVITTVK
ncbi:Ig-like domain-containing protein [Paenibacillus tuaregi]|uniref:Ig-like domain-containing protein n=1 Tax=Paenibacillus tuaregi TaxID=1816681 RepID=UPI0008390027|nr:Ig-like domain-containing protein [Paenibacillus tuaregi]